jgi:glycosyltransferase involved in cell wall biosynthesis
MKILLDMQGVQTESRHRGIGRYCLAVTRAFIGLSQGVHETTLLFNAALDGVDEAIAALGEDSEAVRRRIIGPIRNTSSDNRANDARRGAAEHVFTYALQARQPDVVWLGSVVEGFADDALVPHEHPGSFTVATLYDLIPLHDPEYLGHARARDWYMSRIEALRRCDLLLAISEWVRSDAIERLGLDPQRIVAIGGGVEPHFAPPAPGTDPGALLQDRFGITRPFVMYNGGFDKRKNVFTLLEAYSSLPAALRAKHVLVIVGRVDTLLRERFADTLVTLRLQPDEVIFTGFVSDADLVQLYQACALFVFPSEREGFGLAPLEAMACGAPVIVNDATSLPEVVGNPEALFDVRLPGVMAARIEAALTDAALATRLRHSGLERASHFTWSTVATRALAAIEGRANGDNHQNLDADRPSTAPHYRLDATNVVEQLAHLRQWPGSVIWSGPLPDVPPLLAADRFRLGGYAALISAGSPSDWLTLLNAESIGMVNANTMPDNALLSCLEAIQQSHPLALQLKVEHAIATSTAPELADDDLARVADAIARTRPCQHARWLVDVTHIGTNDLGTGVHRVVRSILREWLIHPPEGTRIEPVIFSNGRFHHAHKYACNLIGADPASDLPGDIVAVTGNEVYVGLDWTMESLPSSSALLRTWRRAGVSMHFIVYDLLPLTMPEAFHSQSREAFAKWMTIIGDIADVLHCISRTTAADVVSWLRQNKQGRQPSVESFELGADIKARTAGGASDAALEAAMSAKPSLLMVGTVEPRKGHVQVLDAAELLWESGADVNLVIIGHRGWLVNDLVERLQQHREKGKRLFWLDDADDATLEAAYNESTVLLAASRGEGYGLPLIEAAHRGKPVIARSLPVFREVAGDYPSYFDTESASGLATHIARWLTTRPHPGSHPEWLTWRQSAELLRRSISRT